MNNTSPYGGRPVGLCPHTGQPADKWQLLNLATLGATRVGLTHRSLSVLKALLTFLPDRRLAPDRPAVVFPSNKTLSERLNGMPESTLRRHLSALVKSGFVSRQDSPNRKRYARFAGTQGIAFGFDLAPLARAASRLMEIAAEVRTAQQQRAMLHAEINALCHQIGPCEETADAKKALRRKNNPEELDAHLHTLRRLSKTLPMTQDMNDTDSQNERHIQNTEKKDSVEIRDRDLSAVKSACTSATELIPDAFASWSTSVQAARQLAPMIGIENAVLHQAEATLGPRTAAVTVFAMLERVASLRNPGGYLRHLTQLGAEGTYTGKSALRLANCQLTIEKTV